MVETNPSNPQLMAGWRTDLLVGVAAVCLSELTIAIQHLEVVVLGLQA